MLNGMERSLIPKKSVFDRLHFDLTSAEIAKNKENHDDSANLTEGMDRIDRFTHSSTFQISNSMIPHAANSHLGRFPNSNVASFQPVESPSQFCARCLRVGHWHKCERPGHYATSCPGLDKIRISAQISSHGFLLGKGFCQCEGHRHVRLVEGIQTIGSGFYAANVSLLL
jgi:hypothetical protein